MKPTRREFVASVGAAAAGFAASPRSAPSALQQGKPAKRPNILVLLSDQHSKRFLGCYGNEIVRTPHLDRLAHEGMRLESVYCPAPLCVPSRMSFLTGRTPSANRVWHNSCILGSGIPTWAHVLSAAGYETSLVGRMHFQGPDQRHGFENRPIGEYQAGHPGSRLKTKDPKGRIYYHGGSGQSRSAVERAGRGRTTYQSFDERITVAACEYLRQRAGPRERPFAAVVGLVLPHCPFIAPKELYDYYARRVDIPDVEADQPETIRRFRSRRKILTPPLPPERVRIARAAYYGMCEHLDGLIGNVLDCLDETGLAENTLVVYTTDHGEMAGEHGCWWKSNYYESSVGVPLVARLPGRIPAGSVSGAVSGLVDLGPTFAQVAGTTMPDASGRSLWPTLQGRHPASWTNETTSEFCDSRDGYLPSRMIRSDEWKLWYYHDKENLPPSLFNLREDPNELNDLGEDPKYADVRNELLEKLRADWDPESSRRESIQASKDFATLTRWGRAVNPPRPDALEIPPPSFEADVELL